MRFGRTLLTEGRLSFTSSERRPERITGTGQGLGAVRSAGSEMTTFIEDVKALVDRLDREQMEGVVEVFSDFTAEQRMQVGNEILAVLSDVAIERVIYAMMMCLTDSQKAKIIHLFTPEQVEDLHALLQRKASAGQRLDA